ncbi:MAG: hypothetical protein ACXVBQ_06575 [Pseudobdellovibrionaceae bacterium]
MNPNIQPSFLEYPKDLSTVNNIYLKTNFGILDIMSELPPIGSFNTIKKNSLEISLYGHRCKVISLEDLIKIKQSMSRPKDQETLRELLKIKSLQKK